MVLAFAVLFFHLGVFFFSTPISFFPCSPLHGPTSSDIPLTVHLASSPCSHRRMNKRNLSQTLFQLIRATTQFVFIRRFNGRRSYRKKAPAVTFVSRFISIFPTLPHTQPRTHKLKFRYRVCSHLSMMGIKLVANTSASMKFVRYLLGA